MRINLDAQTCRNFEIASQKEWLLPNGIGGYAMGTVSGANTRRYHGLLVAATVPPAHRMVLLANIEAFVQTDGSPIGISCNQYQGAIFPEGYQVIESFQAGTAVEWVYGGASWRVKKSLIMHPGENVITVRYENIGTVAIGLMLRPLVSHKFYHHNFRVSDGYPASIQFPSEATTLEHEGVLLALQHPGAQRIPAMGWYYRFEAMRELERGLDPRDDLYCPCELRYELAPGESAVLVAADRMGVAPQEVDANEPLIGPSLKEALKFAASKFLVQGPERTSIIAGYPWFTDWGRDTMISLPGICLHTGKVDVARAILQDYMAAMKQGLIPNRFVEEGHDPEYNTVDATLWMANAIYLTLKAEWNEPFAKKAFAALTEMRDWHIRGTLYGIQVEPESGLLCQGQDGVQLTWMDAKIGDWVVTPRNGKPVEIQALWINANRILEWLADQLGEDSAPARQSAEQAEQSFEAKFWRESLGFYLDCADPDDASLRPNQVLAMALPFSPMDPDHARLALDKIGTELLTENGLRTLGPREPGYKGRYVGPLADLDAAYHQGTVWPWLLGPYATALVKFTGTKTEAKRVLRSAREMLLEYGLMGIGEVYDGDKPRRAAGCPFQAWSVAEVLRAWVEDVGGS